ncbi:MAG TPA: ABC-F family ATP-binding cassette domain-containing protein [Dissulfurispiraceae bacterium]|nr:ABC-F family ATP-binding cassette domain-containing protein [Dissulfurispiraceae bacterium]
MIQVSNLNKIYGRQGIFEGASFNVNPGERIGLVGRNGSGKTTLFRMITKQEVPDSGVIGIPNNYVVGYLSQHLSFSEDTVLKEGCLGLRESDNNKDESYRVRAVLQGLGFSDEDINRSPLELSGGFQVRLSLAKSLIGEPDLLLLDEPTNYLDILSIRWLRDFLRNWKRELIIITHDRSFMDSVTTHTMGIHRLRIRKVSGTTDKLYDQLLAEEESYERTRVNDDRKREEIERFISRFRVQANKAKAVQSRIKALDKRKRMEQHRRERTLEFSFPYEAFEGKWLMSVHDLSFSYGHDAEPLINGLGFSVGKSDRIGIIGKNGKGKTTLLNLLAGELLPRGGQIVRNQKTEMAYFGQTNIDRLDPGKTVEDEIMDVHPEHNRKAARTICGIMMFEGDDALKKISVLSGGEKSRVLLGKLLVSRSNLLLLDEPTNHLDMESVDSLIEALDAYEGAVIIVTHSEMILNSLVNRLIVFDDDRVTVFDGTYEDFLDRVGWRNEALLNERQCSTAKYLRNADRREARRLKAELINERSRSIGDLQRRISDAEESIIKLEQSIENDTASVLLASETGDWQSAASLSKVIHDAKQKIELLFGDLEVLNDELANKSKEFEEKLACME